LLAIPESNFVAKGQKEKGCQVVVADLGGELNVSISMLCVLLLVKESELEPKVSSMAAVSRCVTRQIVVLSSAWK